MADIYLYPVTATGADVVLRDPDHPTPVPVPKPTQTGGGWYVPIARPLWHPVPRRFVFSASGGMFALRGGAADLIYDKSLRLQREDEDVLLLMHLDAA